MHTTDNQWCDLYQDFHELFESEWLSRLPIRTLAQLEFSDAEHALASGFVQIRMEQDTQSGFQPGLWIASTDIGDIERAVEEIESSRYRRKKKRQDPIGQQIIEQIQIITGLDKNTVNTWLSAQRKDAYLAVSTTPSSCPQAGIVAASGLSWRQAPLKPHGFFLPGARLRVSLPADVPSPELRALVQGHTQPLIEFLEEQLKRTVDASNDILLSWEASRPDWFEHSDLQRWAALPASVRGIHPLRMWLKMERMLAALKKFRLASGTRFDATSLPEAFDVLWRTPMGKEYDPEKAAAALQDMLEARLQTVRAQFFEQRLAQLVPVLDDLSEHEIRAELAKAWDRVMGVSGTLNLTLIEGALTQLTDSFVERHKRQRLSRDCIAEIGQSLKNLYPLARSMGRRITFYAGPTNSGKTHRALQQLAQAPSGLYLAPLRLLALEVQEHLNSAGVPTSLLTGEARIDIPGAGHCSATVEMLDVNTPVDVAVIDEIQMIADRDRGPAWVQAFLAAPARHVVVVGSACAKAVVEHLARYTGEELEIVELERLAPLEVAPAPIGLKDVKPGSAVVAFSRRDVLSLAAALRWEGRRTAVIYGSLAPEVRREQARRFREGHAEILVATDAIGMGLNLPVHTVVFATASKFDGTRERQLQRAEIQQIAGRAGRYGFGTKGQISAFDERSLKIVRRAMNAPPLDLPATVQFGFSSAIAQAIARQIGSGSLVKLLRFFQQNIRLDAWAKPLVTTDEIVIAGFLDTTRLDLKTKLRLLGAPGTAKDLVLDEFAQMVACIESDVIEDFPWIMSDPGQALEALESLSRSLSLYCWMSLRFPEIFNRRPQAQDQHERVVQRITEALARQPRLQCRQCNRILSWNHRHRLCEECHRSRIYGPDDY